MAVEIGLRLVELGVVTVGAAKHAPVDIPYRVAGRIRPVVRKLRAEATQRAAVAPHPQAFHHLARDEFEIAQALQQLGVEVVGIWQMLGHFSRGAGVLSQPSS